MNNVYRNAKEDLDKKIYPIDLKPSTLFYYPSDENYTYMRLEGDSIVSLNSGKTHPASNIGEIKIIHGCIKINPI